MKSNTILRRSVNPKKKGKVSKRPALQEGVPWEKEPPKRYELVSKGNQPTCFAFKKRGCPKGNACNCCWLPPECSYHQKEGCKLWKMCVIRHTEQAGGETKKRSTSAVVSNTMDITQAGEEVTSLKSRTKGDLLHWFFRYASDNLFCGRLITKLLKSSVYLASQNIQFMNATRKAPLWE